MPELNWATGRWGTHTCCYCEQDVDVRRGDGQIRLISNDEFEVKCHSCQQAWEQAMKRAALKMVP